VDIEDIKKTAINSVVGVGISLLFILLNGLGLFDFLYDWSNYISEPITFGVGEFGQGVGSFFSTIVEIGTLKEENSRLQMQNSELSAQIEKSNEINLQNEILMSQLGADLTENWNLSLARILGVDRAGPSEHVVVDLGSQDGIEVGDPVILGDILVGDVREVYLSTSRVRLVTNRNSNIAAMDRNSRAKGLVRGSLDGLVIEDILESEEINKGDVIISWSDELPDSLVIGTIREVIDDPTSSTNKAYLDPAVSLSNLNYVFIVEGF
jgi:rod shape-determining protein MreC